jgi:hypothetical protein
MRLIQALVLVAALALSVVVCATTASAARLCQNENSDPCSAAYGKGQAIEATLKSAKIPIGVWGPVECTGGMLKGQSTDAGGGAGFPVGVKIESMTLTPCTCPSGKASATAIFPAPPNEFWKAEVNWKTLKNGTLKILLPKIRATCAPESCLYTKAQIELEVKGENPAEIIAEAAKTKMELIAGESTIGCPAESSITATWEVTKPKPLFITNE